MSDLPVGTVTFLFTDVEGSTRLWESFPQAMKAASARHFTLLRLAVERSGGVVFKTVGDGLCAAFRTAPQALAAALEAQRALRAETWGETGQLKVRMALHTGAVEVEGGDYVGPHLNRLARLLSIGHGGQVLLSQATFELVRDALPEGASLRELGEQRLRDLTRPEQVYQLVHPELPTGFPPLHTTDTQPNNLPLQLTSFVGRERELAEVKRLLGTTRLLTLTGTGGCGKTRLALQVVAELFDNYRDGVYLVELASLADPALVPQTVASALGLREQSNIPILSTLQTVLRSKTTLLVLDNCEHLLDACARLSTTLLQSCPYLCILATSREALGIGGEVSWRVPSLSVLPLDHLSASSPELPAALANYDAVRLFVERATAVQADFSLTERNALAVAQLCHRLDGIPLALELAATRVRGMSVEQIVSRLDQRFRLLTGGSRSALPRQQTLRATIDWSYDLLSEPERVVLRRLAAFSGGWTLEALEAVGASERLGQIEGSAPLDALDILLRLVDKSLVVAEAEGEGTRYRLHETIRQHAREKLVESGEAEAVHREHAAYYLGLAEEAGPELTGPRQRDWVDRLETERDNVRGALQWFEESGEVERGLLLADLLWLFWNQRGPYLEAEARLEALLRLPGARETPLGVKALANLAFFAKITHGTEAARPSAEESLTLGRALGDLSALAWALWAVGFVESDRSAGEHYFLEALELCQVLGDHQLTAMCHAFLGIAELSGDLMMARAHGEESVRFARALGGPQLIGRTLWGLSLLACRHGDLIQAWDLAEESLRSLEEAGDWVFIAWTRLCQATVLRLRGELDQARQLAHTALRLGQEAGDRTQMAGAEAELALIASAQGEFDLARKHLRASFGQVPESEYLAVAPRDVVPLLALIARAEGDSSQARRLLEERLKAVRELGARVGEAACLGNLGVVALNEWQLEEAEGLLRESLVLRREMGDRGGIATLLESFGGLWALRGQAEQALRLLGAGNRLREAIGNAAPPVWRKQRDPWLDRAKQALDPEIAAEALSDAQEMTLEQAVEYALSESHQG